MWNIVVLTTLLTLTGFYATSEREVSATIEQVKASDLAESVALYRQAVTTYFAENPTAAVSSVDIYELKSSKALPSWSRLYTNPETSIWANFRDDDGRIFIYATSAPATSIVSELVALSHGSELVGIRTRAPNLISPLTGDTKAKFPPSTKVNIPIGSPVWVASGL